MIPTCAVPVIPVLSTILNIGVEQIKRRDRAVKKATFSPTIDESSKLSPKVGAHVRDSSVSSLSQTRGSVRQISLIYESPIETGHGRFAWSHMQVRYSAGNESVRESSLS